MRRFALLDVCVLTVLAVVMVLVPDAAGQRNRPGEAPERVCRGGNQQRPVRGGLCGSAIPNAVSQVCRNQGKRSDSFLNTFTKGKDNSS